MQSFYDNGQEYSACKMKWLKKNKKMSLQFSFYSNIIANITYKLKVFEKTRNFGKIYTLNRNISKMAAIQKNLYCDFDDNFFVA